MSKGKIIQVSAIDVTMDKLLGTLNQVSLQEGYEVIGVCSEGKSVKKLRDEGLNLYTINIDRSIKPLSNVKSIIELYKLFKKEKPDVVHVHTPIAAVLGRIAARLARVPNIIYTAHGFYFHENMSSLTYKIFFNIEKYMGRHFTDFIFTQSEEDCEVAIENKFLKDTSKIMAIGNGVDVNHKFNSKNIDKSKVEALKEELGIGKEDKVVTFIGRLVREKGILDLLEGFNQLDREDIKLIAVGDIFQGDRDMECKNAIEKYKSNKNIIFAGRRDDINHILYLTDIFCLPSYREGMPRSIIEAMAMECAVVATNIRGSREEVIEGETGFLVPINNPRAIKDKIEALVEDEVLLTRMKAKGRERAEALYDEYKVVAKQLKVFENLINHCEKRGNYETLRRNFK